jgi:hypothetical protein
MSSFPVASSSLVAPTPSESGRRPSSTSPLPMPRDLVPPENVCRLSNPSPAPSSRDLAPPQLPRTVRSGSSTSMTSGGSSSYTNTNAVNYRPRPSLDDTRAGSSNYGRSPLSGGSELSRSVSPGGPKSPVGSGSLGGLGLGMPPRRGSGSGSASGSGIDGAPGPVDMVRRASAGPNLVEPPGSRSMNRRPSGETGTHVENGQNTQSHSRSRTPTQNANNTDPPNVEASQPVSSLAPPALNGDSRKAPPSAIHPPHPSAPTITTTLPSPLIPQEVSVTSPTTHRIQRRASFHPPPMNTAFSREVLLTSKAGLLPGGGMVVADDKDDDEAILANVEEMLEGFEWTTGGDGKKKGSTDAIENRLLDELAALDSVSRRL